MEWFLFRCIVINVDVGVRNVIVTTPVASGNDEIFAGIGNDDVLGGSGDDVIFGGPGDDDIDGGGNDDEIHGEAGDDTLRGNAGNDEIRGYEGIDMIFGGREAARKDDQLMAQCRDKANRYVSADGVTLTTTKEAVAGSFLLKKLFHDVMDKHECFAVTTRGCMGSYAGIMPCLTLTMINDDGYMAYCEGDFVVIPAHILTHFTCGKPTYFCNPTFPHKGRMMFAHCTAPRRMDGKDLAPVDLVTHYESDHGAATHVHFPKGQLLTIIKPDFEAKRWLAFTGKILGAPFIDTCRAQVEVELNADTADVLNNLRGFHCILTYGDHTKEVTYAARKVGIEVQTLRA